MQVINGLYRTIINEKNAARFAEVELKNGEVKPVLNLTVVPESTKDGDNIGTEWIQVTLWGNAAKWYQNIPHNTIVYIRGLKDIENWENGDKTGSSSKVTIGMYDAFKPFIGPWRDDAAANEDVKTEKAQAQTKARSVTSTTEDDEIPF